ncbi:MAG: RHS repeat-associated core domain-containing protein [Telluria sp.]|nr:RHS repeat-associated core domain-containing protein [Telluria sp.]
MSTFRLDHRFPKNIQRCFIPLIASACLASAAGAQSGPTLVGEQGKLIRAPQAFTTLGPALFGDKINVYNGSLEFAQEDVSIPGNNKLRVAVGRRTIIGGSGNEGDGLFKNWDLDIPRVYGLFSKQYGWTAVNAAGQPTTERCTTFNGPPTVYKPNSDAKYRPWEYWHGTMLYVPGEGEQEVLRRNTAANTNIPTDGVATPLVTKNLWAIRCLPTLASTTSTTPANEAGQGFLAIGPDGTQYRFDWLVSRPMSVLSKAVAFSGSTGTDANLTSGQVSGSESVPSPQGEGRTMFSIARTEVSIFPTLVTDRYGNTVRYAYDSADKWKLMSITSADVDGNSERSLTFTYVPGTRQVQSVSDGTRTWNYTYGTGANGNAILTAVTLPDSSRWELAGLDGVNGQPGLVRLFIDYMPDGTSGEGCDEQPTGLTSPVAVGELTHPSGATGTFTMTPTQHARNGVPRLCYTDDATFPGRAKFPQYYDVYSITDKTITGPGISPSSWKTLYDTFNPGWDDCSTCGSVPNRVSVTDPAGVVTLYSFGSTFGVDEGMIKQLDIGWNGSSAARTTTTRYNYSFTSPIGFSDQDRGDLKTTSRHIPADQRIILQDGVSFNWQVPAAGDFDKYARPLKAIRSSSLGMTRTDVIAYYDNTAKWLLGQIRSVTDAGTGKVTVLNGYFGATGNLETISRFGKLEQTITYHRDGTIASRKDGKNQTTLFDSYKRGIAQLVTYHNGTTERAIVNNIGTVASTTDAAGFTTSYDDDAMGRLAGINYPTGGTVAWSRTSIIPSKVDMTELGIEPGHWRQEVHTGNAYKINHYDALWRPIITEVWDNADSAGTMRVTTRRFDHAGRLTFESYPQRNLGLIGPGNHHEYDALGRPTVTGTESELGVLYSGFAYISGFKKVSTTARGIHTISSFQVFDEPSDTAISDIAAPEGVSVSITRDVFGKPTSIIRSGGTTSAMRRYVYDEYERLCKTVEPETGASIQEYDPANNVVWRASGLNLPSPSACDRASAPLAKRVTFDYDGLNRLTSTKFGDNSPAIARSYTNDGLPSVIASNGAVWTNTYNNRRLNERESLVYGGATYNIDRRYDANASLRELTYPDNTLVAYAPNALGEATQVGSYASAVTYHPNGAVAGFRYGNGIMHTMTQNTRGLPEWSTDAGVLRDNYVYDENGNVSFIWDWQQGVSNRGMTYDALDRLTRVDAGTMWGSAAYTYDSLDNITSTRVDTGATARTASHTYDPASNLLTNIVSTNAAYNLGFAYDALGNVTTRGSQSFVFDQGNRMSSATGKGSYTYDGLGRRVSTVGSDGVNRVTVYSQGGQMLFARATSTSLGAGMKYIHLRNHLIAESSPAGTTYAHTDGLGSPVAITSSAGGLVSRTRYEPYGLTASGATTAIGFTGHVNAADIGLVYMQQRYYDPVAGRFLSIDPVVTDANTGTSFNRYAYAANNPYKYIDPDGRQASERFVEQHRKDMEAGKGDLYKPLMPVAVVGTVAMAVGPVAIAAVRALAPTTTQATTQAVSKTETILTSPKNLLPTQPKSDLTGSVVNRLTKDMKQNGFDPAKPISGQTTATGRIEIVDGHHRAAAAIKAGIEKVPVEVFTP